jgi:hypothetical protein
MSTKKYNRRDFLRLSAAVAAGAGLASCAPQTQTPQTNGGKSEPEIIKETVVVEGETKIVTATPPPETVKLVIGAYVPT